MRALLLRWSVGLDRNSMLHQWLRMLPSDSFDTVLKRYRGIGPGFDFLRIFLALVIFVGHAKWIAGLNGMAIDNVAHQASLAAAHTAGLDGLWHVTPWAGLGRPFKLALVPMFFALSGFLVMGSAVRLKSTSTFLAHRVLRILPALVVEVALSACVLGWWFTNVPLDQYVSDPQFLRYFQNIWGNISYSLPGVFAGNPVPFLVNVNLWTLPSEFYCYLAMALLMLTRLVYHRAVFSVLMLLATLGLAMAHALTGLSAPLGPYPAHVVVYYFFVGVLFFHWKDRIPASPWLFLASLPLSYALLMFDALTYVAPVVVAYMTLFVGLLPIPKSRVLSSGDYSYGLYLYGFPITQALVAWRPQWFSGSLPAFMGLLLVATVLSFAFAAISWHLIEKHALALKSWLPQRWFPVPARGSRA